MSSEFLINNSDSDIDWDHVDWNNYPDPRYHDDTFIDAQLVKIHALDDKLKAEGTLSTMTPEEMYRLLKEITQETAAKLGLPWPPPLLFKHKG